MRAKTKHRCRRLLGALVPLAWLVIGDWTSTPRAFAQVAAAWLTNVQQVLNLPASEARQGRPVRLRGIVTYCDLEWNLLFLRDATGSCFITPSGIQPPLESGDRIELEGVSAADNGGTKVSQPRARVLGRDPMPAARRLAAEDLFSGRAVNQWVEINGRVRFVNNNSMRLQLELVAQGKRFKATVRHSSTANMAELADATVRLRGVCANTYDDQGRLTGAQLFIPSLAEVTVESAAAADPFALRTNRIDSLARLFPRGTEARRVQVAGIALHSELGVSVTIQDPTGTLRLLTRQMTVVKNGDGVRAVGFPGWQASELVLEDAILHVTPMVPTADRTATRPVGAVSPPGPSPSRLERVEDIRALTRAQAARGIPIALEGVVTYYDADWKILFIQDATAGIYVDLKGEKYPIQPRQRVRIEGVTGAGDNAPVIVASHVHGMGMGEFPQAKSVTLDHLASGAEDSQWVEIQGGVRAVTNEWGRVRIGMLTSDGRFQAHTLADTNGSAFERLKDAAVRLTGVCAGVFNPQRQFVGIEIWMPPGAALTVLEPAPADPFSRPVRTIAELGRLTPEESNGRCLHVRGLMTLQKPGQYLYIQDESGGLYIESAQSEPLAKDRWLDVLGYPALDNYRVSLREAVYRPSGKATPVRPARVTAKDVLAGLHEAELVEMDARLLNWISDPMQDTLLLQTDDLLIFSALLAGNSLSRPAAFPQGSRVRLQGVSAVSRSSRQQISTLRLLLPASENIHLLSRPPWWTPQRALLAVATLGLLIAAALAWVGALEYRVRRQTIHIRQHLEKETVLEQRYRDLYENASDIIYTCDLEGNFTSLNNAAERFFGCAQAEMPRLGLAGLLPAGKQAHARQFIQGLLAGETGPPTVLEMVCQGGVRRFLEINGRLLLEGDRAVGLQCIGRDVTERKRAEEELKKAQVELLHASRLAGMAEIATGVLHNVGNVLNSVNVSTTLVAERLRRSKIGSLVKTGQLLRTHETDLADFMAHDPRGRRLPAFLASLADHLESEQKAMLVEIESLVQNVEHIKQIVAMQQTFARVSGVREPISMPSIVEDALQMYAYALRGYQVEVIRDYQEVPVLTLDKHKVLQILLNLIRNAQHALDECPASQAKRLRISVGLRGDGGVRIAVQDTGVGIDPENLTRIFAHGFTTKKDGHGFGLHMGALAAREMGGSLTAYSEGPGRGATFVLELPATAPKAGG